MRLCNHDRAKFRIMTTRNHRLYKSPWGLVTNYGEGGYKMGGGHVKFNHNEKRKGGGRKGFSHAERGGGAQNVVG